MGITGILLWILLTIILYTLWGVFVVSSNWSTYPKIAKYIKSMANCPVDTYLSLKKKHKEWARIAQSKIGERAYMVSLQIKANYLDNGYLSVLAENFATSKEEIFETRRADWVYCEVYKTKMEEKYGMPPTRVD